MTIGYLCANYLTQHDGSKRSSLKLTDNEDEVDYRISGNSIVLRTEFLKKL